MEVKLLNTRVRIGYTERFTEKDLTGENLVYGGIVTGTKGGGYIFINWIETPTNDCDILEKCVSIV